MSILTAGSLCLPERIAKNCLMIYGVSQMATPQIPVHEAQLKQSHKQKFRSHNSIKPIQSLLGRFLRIDAAGCALALMVATSTSALAQSSGQTRPSKLTEVETVTQNSDGSGNTWIGWGVASHMGKFTS